MINIAMTTEKSFELCGKNPVIHKIMSVQKKLGLGFGVIV